MCFSVIVGLELRLSSQKAIYRNKGKNLWLIPQKTNKTHNNYKKETFQ